jgi:hypothetical protein
MKTSQFAEAIGREKRTGMRSNQNPSSSVTRSVGDRNAVPRGPIQSSEREVSRGVVGKLSMPQMPVEWLDSGSWRLPSGKALAEFALQAGFLAPLLFRADRFGKGSTKGSAGVSGSEIAASGTPARGKQFSKGDGR